MNTLAWLIASASLINLLARFFKKKILEFNCHLEERIMIISTSHLSAEGYTSLIGLDEDGSDQAGPSTYSDRIQYGFLITVLKNIPGDKDDQWIHEDLIPIAKKARKSNIKFVLIDEDGPINKSLPILRTYEPNPK